MWWTLAALLTLWPVINEMLVVHNTHSNRLMLSAGKRSLGHAVPWLLPCPPPSPTGMLSLVGMGLGPGTLPSLETKHSHSRRRLIMVLCCKLNVCSFVLLKSKRLMEPGQPHCYRCPLRGTNGILPLRHKRAVYEWITLCCLPGESCWPWGPNADCWSWSCSVFCVSKGW